MKLSKLRAKTSVRSVAGCDVPRQNSTSFGMRAALKKAGHSPYAGESGDVEGSPAKVRLDRARRNGGSVKRADGGPVGARTISTDSKDAAAKLRDESSSDYWKGLIGANLGNLMMAIPNPGVGRVARKIAGGLKGAGMAGGWTVGGAGVKSSWDKSKEADRIEKGLVKEGEEDRKFGGRIKKRARGGRVGRADGGKTPGQQMQEARKRRDDAGTERNELGAQAFMNAGARAALHGVPGKFGKVLKGANTLLAGTGALGATASHGKKIAAEDEMKRLGDKPAVEGEEDRKHGGKVKSKR